MMQSNYSEGIEELNKRVKARGVRLFHESLRNCTIVVDHPTKRYPQPYACGVCNTNHRMKAIHLNLDGEGSVIVSEGVLKDLQTAGMPGLSVSNEVLNPPMQTISLGYKYSEVQQQAEKEPEKEKLTVIRRMLLKPGAVMRNIREK